MPKIHAGGRVTDASAPVTPPGPVEAVVEAVEHAAETVVADVARVVKRTRTRKAASS